MNVTTKTGDNGYTTNFFGKRVRKCHLSIEISGIIDEIISFMGLAIYYSSNQDFIEELKKIQRDLFNLFSLNEETIKNRILFIENFITKNEKYLDGFIYPGENRSSTLLHIIRCSIRRLERNIVKFKCSNSIKIYLNRLSDYFFVLTLLN